MASGVYAIDTEVGAEALDLHEWHVYQSCRLLQGSSSKCCRQSFLRLSYVDMGACLSGQGRTIST